MTDYISGVMSFEIEDFTVVSMAAFESNDILHSGCSCCGRMLCKMLRDLFLRVEFA